MTYCTYNQGLNKQKLRICGTLTFVLMFSNFWARLRTYCLQNDLLFFLWNYHIFNPNFVLIFYPFSFQNYINESLKYLDKSYPNTSLAGLHTPMSDTKPIYIDTKALLGHHVDNNKNNTKWLWFRRKENTQKNITILLDHPKYQQLWVNILCKFRLKQTKIACQLFSQSSFNIAVAKGFIWNNQNLCTLKLNPRLIWKEIKRTPLCP